MGSFIHSMYMGTYMCTCALLDASSCLVTAYRVHCRGIWQSGGPILSVVPCSAQHHFTEASAGVLAPARWH